MTKFSRGLSTAEAQKRLNEFGPNLIVPSQLESRLAEIKKVLLDPMGLMLLSLAGLYALLGNQSDAAMLLIAYIPVTAVDVILELRAHKALRALRATLKKTAKLLRDGEVHEVSTHEIVPGDVIVFEEGQSLPADGKVIEAEQLLINEAALTGESIPIEKNLEAPFFGGTTVLTGRGLGLVETTGKKTRFGAIATLLEETEAESTPLQKRVNALVKRVVFVALFLALALFALTYWRSFDFTKSLIVALTFGMSAVPEEFPLVFSLYLSLGAWRLSKHGVLVKSLPSVEALGSIDLICTDKTGTLTEGQFQLEKTEVFNASISTEKLWKIALMACEEKAIDSMEIAIVEKGKEHLTLLQNWKLRWDYPFELKGKHMSHVWEHTFSGQSLIAMKGAVEGVLEHCQTNEDDLEKIHTAVSALAGQGKRLLGLAFREGPCKGDRASDEQGLHFVGLLVFNDPVRPSAIEAITHCQAAGIKVKMLTGDHPLTAHAVADETGINHSHDDFYTGDQLAKMSKEERWKAYLHGTIFSRVVPEQKHEMIQAFKADGRIVAMTGDGINDAPALKLADIGISMGVNATDVARSTAQMILLKNDFKGIVEAVFEGRRIFNNLRRSFSYLISFHIPVILLTLTPPLFGWGELLLPIHIVLLELVVHPISAFAFENLRDSIAPANEKALLPKRRFFEAVLSGVLLSVGSLVLFRNYDIIGFVEAGRSIALATILFGNIFFVLVEGWPHRTWRIFITAFCLLLLTGMIMEISSAASLFHLTSLNFLEMSWALAIGLLASTPSFLMRVWSINASSRVQHQQKVKT